MVGEANPLYFLVQDEAGALATPTNAGIHDRNRPSLMSSPALEGTQEGGALQEDGSSTGPEMPGLTRESWDCVEDEESASEDEFLDEGKCEAPFRR